MIDIKNDSYVNLLLKTSFSDFNDFFDFNSFGIKIQNIKVKNEKEGLYFVRKKNNHFIQKIQHKDINIDKGEELIFYLRISKNNIFTIENPLQKKMKKTIKNINNLNNKLWYIIKSNFNRFDDNNKVYYLNINDIIRFGNSKYELIMKNTNINNINTENNNQIVIQNKYDINNLNKNTESIFCDNCANKFIYSKKNEDITCRICFDNSSDINNPLIILCKCHDFIHYDCLKRWIKTKINIIENRKKNVLSYYSKKYNCDVCITPYPLTFKISEINKVYNLIDLQLPTNINYFVLESLDNIRNNGNLKAIHIIKLTGENINFGRNEDNDIIDFHPSVSRKHAVFKYNTNNGEIYIENQSEAFDTAVLVKNSISINKEKIDLEIGRTIVTANLIEKK